MSKIKIWKLFGLVALCLSLTAVCQTAQAATDTEALQPAAPGEAVKIGDLGRYFDEYSSYMQLDTALHSSETMHLPDVHIGGQGVGGVTFFNGTIINDTTHPETGADQPVTVGDKLRVDDYIYRNAPGGADGMPVLIGDDLAPALDDANSLGVSGRRWQYLHVSDNIYGGNIIHEDNLSITNSPTKNYYLGYAGNNQFTWMNVADNDTLGLLSCSDGQIAVYDSITTSWACGNQTDDGDTLGGLSCANGQIAVYNSTTSSWTCGNQTADSDTLGDLICNDGEIAYYETATSSWTCINLCTLYDQQCLILVD